MRIPSRMNSRARMHGLCAASWSRVAFRADAASVVDNSYAVCAPRNWKTSVNNADEWGRCNKVATYSIDIWYVLARTFREAPGTTQRNEWSESTLL